MCVTLPLPTARWRPACAADSSRRRWRDSRSGYRRCSSSRSCVRKRDSTMRPRQVRAHTHTHTHTHTDTHTHTHTHVHAHALAHTNTHTNAHTHLHAHALAHTHTRVIPPQDCVKAVPSHTHTHTHPFVRVCTRVCVYSRALSILL